MVTELVVIPKGIHSILRRLTGQSRPDVALSLAIKELIHFRIESTKARIASYEQKYEMDFPKFEEAWKTKKLINHTHILWSRITCSGKLHLPILCYLKKF